MNNAYRRTLTLVLQLVMVALLVVGCGGSATSSDAGSTSATTLAPAAAVTPASAAATEAPAAASMETSTVAAATEAPAAAASTETSAATAAAGSAATAAGAEASPAVTAAPTAVPLPVSNAECKLDPAPDQATTISYLGNKFPVVEYFANQLKSCEGGNLKVNLDWLPANERDQKANLVLSSGDTSYEIIQATQRNIYEWGAKGWIMPLDELIAKYKEQYNLADIPQPVFEGVTFDGKVFGIPFNQNGQLFFYRKDIYDKYGLKPPATWEEAMTQFKMLAEKKDTPYVYAATYAKGSDLAGEFARTYQSAGGTWFNDDATPAFNTPEAVATVQLLKDLLQYAPPDVLTYNNDKVMVALQQGQVAAAVSYISRASRMDDPTQSTVVGKIEYAPVPAFKQGGPTGTSVGGDSYVIPAKTKVDPDLIFRVIMEATTAERQKPGANLSMMTRQSVATDPEVVKMNRYLPAVTEALQGKAPPLAPYPKVPYYSLAIGALGNILAQALTGDIPIEDALKQAAEEYEIQALDKGFIK